MRIELIELPLAASSASSCIISACVSSAGSFATIASGVAAFLSITAFLGVDEGLAADLAADFGMSLGVLLAADFGVALGVLLTAMGEVFGVFGVDALAAALVGVALLPLLGAALVFFGVAAAGASGPLRFGGIIMANRTRGNDVFPRCTYSTEICSTSNLEIAGKLDPEINCFLFALCKGAYLSEL